MYLYLTLSDTVHPSPSEVDAGAGVNGFVFAVAEGAANRWGHSRGSRPPEVSRCNGATYGIVRGNVALGPSLHDEGCLPAVNILILGGVSGKRFGCSAWDCSELHKYYLTSSNVG